MSINFYTRPDLEKALKLNPYVPGISTPVHPIPTMSGYIGKWLESCYPTGLLSNPVLPPVDKPLLLSSWNTSVASLFYGCSERSHRMLILASSESAWDELRFKRPSKIHVFIRKGQPSSYLQVLGQQTHGIPLVNYVHITNTKEAKSLSSTVRSFIDTYRRPVILLVSPEAESATDTQYYSSIRAKITLKNQVLCTTDFVSKKIRLDSINLADAKSINEGLSKEERDGLEYKNYHIYILGIGYGSTKHELESLSLSTLSSWETAGDAVRNQLNSMLGSTYVAEHIKLCQTKLAGSEVLIPNLDHYPVPPTFDVNLNLSLNRKLKITSPSGLTKAMLALDNTLMQAYNVTQGRHTGIIDCLLSRPNLLSKGATSIIPQLKSLGYNLKVPTELVRYLEKKRKFYSRESVPLNPVTNTELLAYFEPGKYVCKETVYHEATSKPVWVKGTFYDIMPGWSREEHAAGSEPIVDEDGKVIGEDIYQLKISVLQLKVTSEIGPITIKENICRESIAEDEAHSGKSSPWVPVLDEFIQAFDLPDVSHVGITHKSELKTLAEKLKARLPHLLQYQIEEPAKNALKKGGLLASTMGSGKTHMGMATLFLRNKAFNLIVVPPTLVSNWVKTLTEYKFYVQTLLTHESVDELIAHYKSLQGLPPAEKRKRMHAPQEFYITTPEFLALGDWGNKVYEPWKATYRKKEKSTVIDPHGKVTPVETITLSSTRYHAEQEAKELSISLNQPHEYGHHVHACPKCETSREEGFSFRGHCRACGYSAYSYVGTQDKVLKFKGGKELKSTDWIFGAIDDLPTDSKNLKKSFTTSAPNSAVCVRRLLPSGAKHDTESLDTQTNTVVLKTEPKTHSTESYPAYKRLRKIFGAKLIDEVHEVANFDSQKGSAVKSIKADDIWACSGTISRGHVKDIESAILHAYEANSPLCPYSEWDKAAFREQFVTQKIKRSTLYTSKTGYSGKTIMTSKTKSSVSIMPEASNVTLLRKILATKMTMVPPVVVEAEWKLPPMSRKYIPVTLSPASQKYYFEVLANIAEWYKHASSKDIRHNAMSKLWELRHICEGEDKLNVIRSYIQLWASRNEKFVVVSPTKPMFLQIKQYCKDNKLNVIFIDESVPTHKREEITSKFSDPTVIGLVARTKLVNTGLNTLVHACKLLIAGLEYFPSTLRQMERRLVRPGQKSKTVEVIYPIVRLTPKESIEEQMLRLIFRKESAVDEVLQGKIRWIKSAQLIETIMEKQGAGRVLESIMDKKAETISDLDLNAIFESEYLSQPEIQEQLKKAEEALAEDMFSGIKPPSTSVESVAPADNVVTSTEKQTVEITVSPTSLPSAEGPGTLILTTEGAFIVTVSGKYQRYEAVTKKAKQGKPYSTLPGSRIISSAEPNPVPTSVSVPETVLAPVATADALPPVTTSPLSDTPSTLTSDLPGTIIKTSIGEFIVTPSGKYLSYDSVAKKAKQGRPYCKLPGTRL
jgi:SNF2-related domain